MTSSAQTQVTSSDPRVRLDPMATPFETPYVDRPGLDEPDDDTTGSYALEERTALRRVAGLSTELADITEVEYRQLRLERVVLVGVWTTGTLVEAENSRQAEFGEELLLPVLTAYRTAPASELITAIVQHVNAFVGDTPQHDDITCMVVKVK